MHWQNNGGWYYAKLLHLCPSTHLYKDPSFTTMLCYTSRKPCAKNLNQCITSSSQNVLQVKKIINSILKSKQEKARVTIYD